MLEKDVYLTTVGKSFLSFIYSLSFLEKNHKVIVLDDERLKYGELFIDTFWELEKEFLKTWGREREIAPLKNLAQNWQPTVRRLATAQSSSVVGGGPNERADG